MPADCSWCWYRCWCRCQTSRWCLGADTMQRNEQQKLHLQQQTLPGSPHTHKHTHAQTIVNMLRPRSMNCGALLIRCVGQILGQRTHTGRQAKERQRAEREQQWKFPCNTPNVYKVQQVRQANHTAQSSAVNLDAPSCVYYLLNIICQHLPDCSQQTGHVFFVFSQINANF